MDANSRIIKQYCTEHPLMQENTIIVACDGELLGAFVNDDPQDYETYTMNIMRRVLNGAKT